MGKLRLRECDLFKIAQSCSWEASWKTQVLLLPADLLDSIFQLVGSLWENCFSRGNSESERESLARAILSMFYIELTCSLDAVFPSLCFNSISGDKVSFLYPTIPDTHCGGYAGRCQRNLQNAHHGGSWLWCSVLPAPKLPP